MTERKKLEQFRQEFISLVAHHLKNSLSAMRWALDLLRQENTLSAEDKQQLDEIYQKNQDMIFFVTDLLAAARAEGGETPSNQFALDEKIEDIITEVKNQHLSVAISFKKSGEDFPIKTDPQLTTVVFYNIISNAAEYSDPSRGEVKVTLAKEQERYLFSCRNNGLAIHKDERPKIFTRLYRSRGAEEIKKGGSGIGLYLTKIITDQLGWHVWFESPAHKNRGAIFHVEIPFDT